MTQDSQNTPWPLPKFHFIVDYGAATTIPFQEVSGLDREADSLRPQHVKIPVFSVKTDRLSPITLKNGRLAKEHLEWFSHIKTHPMEPQRVVVKLVDETGTVVMGWLLHKARPIQLTATELGANANEVAIECLVLEHEGVSLEKG